MPEITNELLNQFEQVRSSGDCNMFAYHCVVKAAFFQELDALASLTKQEYGELLTHFAEHGYERKS